jgi:hypothetical protein
MPHLHIRVFFERVFNGGSSFRSIGFNAARELLKAIGA